MHQKILMRASAILLAITGLTATFVPKNILGYAGAWTEGFEVFLVQLLGALYLSFAMLNWTARDNLIGGIYSRPVAVANFMHFVVVAVTLVKAFMAGFTSMEVMAGVSVYAIFAVWFGVVLFSHPIKK